MLAKRDNVRYNFFFFICIILFSFSWNSLSYILFLLLVCVSVNLSLSLSICFLEKYNITSYVWMISNYEWPNSATLFTCCCDFWRHPLRIALQLVDEICAIVVVLVVIFTHHFIFHSDFVVFISAWQSENLWMISFLLLII